MKAFFETVWETAYLWYDKDADHMAATVSYYSLFAMVPFLLLTITIVGYLYGKDFIENTLLEWGSVLGPDVLNLLTHAIDNLETTADAFGFPIVGALFFSGMVVVLLNAFTSGLHKLWSIPHQGVRGWVKKSINAVFFIVVVEIYLLFLVGLEAITSYLIDATGLAILLSLVKPLFFIVATTVLFSLVYRILPWRGPSVSARLFGAFIASILFALAKSLVSLYVSATPVPGLFGAAGLMLVLLIWVYATAAIIYFGAAYAHVVETRNKIEGSDPSITS